MVEEAFFRLFLFCLAQRVPHFMFCLLLLCDDGDGDDDGNDDDGDDDEDTDEDDDDNVSPPPPDVLPPGESSRLGIPLHRWLAR